MKIKIYQVDAFAEKLFTGNPAAVCPLGDHWLEDEEMQKIAMENNLAETAFYILQKDKYHIRWFTPTVEVDLCGHATLASAHVLFSHENYSKRVINFDSKSGLLSVANNGEYLAMDFPSDTIIKVDLLEELLTGFDIKPIEAYKGKTDYMLVYDNESQIMDMKYDLQKISQVKARGIIITAKGNRVDFVSRFFAPQSGINEDPVTGSAHTTLTPYWSKVLGKKELIAMQLSKRTGYLKCKNLNERTEISGKAKTYLHGEIQV